MREEIVAMARVTLPIRKLSSHIALPIEKLPPRLKHRRWPSLPSLLIIAGIGIVVLAYLGH